MCFHTFGQCFRLLLDATQQKPENMLKAITENRTENLLLVRSFFIAVFVWADFNISAYAQHYEMKFNISTKIDTLISNLNSYVLYEIVLTS